MIPETELREEITLEFDELDAQKLEIKSDIVSKFKHIDARITIRNSSIGFVADFMVHFIADFICARCLEIFPREFDNTIQLIYVKGTDPLSTTEQIKLKSTDIDKIYYAGSQLDVSIAIREAIVFTIPIASICKNTCRGLCPMCGKNRNKYSCNCTAEKVGPFTVTSSIKDPKRKPSQKK